MSDEIASKNSRLQKPKQTTDVDRRVGQNIARRRSELRLRQDELAQIIGVARTQLQKYESGINRVSPTRLVAIAAALSTDPLTLMMDEAAPMLAEVRALRAQWMQVFDQTDGIDKKRRLLMAAKTWTADGLDEAG